MKFAGLESQPLPSSGSVSLRITSLPVWVKSAHALVAPNALSTSIHADCAYNHERPPRGRILNHLWQGTILRRAQQQLLVHILRQWRIGL